MMRRVLAMGAALSLLLLGAAGAQAQDDEEEEELYFEKESAAYIQIFGAYAYFDDGDTNSSGGGGIIVGVHVSPYVAMEGMYEGQSDTNTHMGIYNLKLLAFPTERIQPYVKIGGGLLGGRRDHDFLAMGRFGGGVQFFLDEYMAIGADAAYGVADHSTDIFFSNLFFTYYFE